MWGWGQSPEPLLSGAASPEPISFEWQRVCFEVAESVIALEVAIQNSSLSTLAGHNSKFAPR